MAAKHVPDTGRVEFVELDIGLEGVADAHTRYYYPNQPWNGWHRNPHF